MSGGFSPQAKGWLMPDNSSDPRVVLNHLPVVPDPTSMVASPMHRQSCAVLPFRDGSGSLTRPHRQLALSMN